MATITVNTDGVSGDYTFLAQAIAAIDDAALTEDTEVVCYATTSADDTTAVSFASINTTASYRLTVRPGDSNYRLRVDVASGAAIGLDGGFGTYSNITIQGLVIRQHGHSGNYQHAISVNHRSGLSIIDGCDIRTEAHTYRDEIISVTMDSVSHGGVCVFVNNLIVSGSTATHTASRIMEFGVQGEVRFYNNTFVAGASTQALYYAATNTWDDSSVWYNNLFSGFAGVYGSLTPGTADYNMTDGEWDLGGEHDVQSASITFVDTTDYRTASGSDAVDAGTSLASDGTYQFSDDIDGNTRSGTWDIGCSEYVAAGGGISIPVVMLQHDHLSGGLW